MVRRLQDLSRPFAKDRRAIVLSAPHIDLPPELEKLAACFRLDLPTKEELRLLARNVVRDLSRQHRIKVGLSSEEFDRLVEGMKGLTLFEAERALTKAVLHGLALTREDLDLIIEIKKGLLGREGVLEYSPPEEGMAQIGGLQNLKKWLKKRKKAFAPEAARFGIQPPKGILLLVVQGCGKSMAAKAMAREWNLPLLRMEPGRLYDKYIGESERNLEKALKLAERMAPCVLMVDEIEKGFASVSTSPTGGSGRRSLPSM